MNGFIVLFSFPTALETADFDVFHVMDIFCAGQLPTTHKPVRECTSPQWAVLADQSVAKANEEMKKRLEFHWQLQAKELKQDHIYSGIFLSHRVTSCL